MLALMPDTSNEALKAWRTSRRLKQREAAELLGISRNYYANLEGGQTMPTRVEQKLKELGFSDRGYTDADGVRPVSLLFGPMVRIPLAGSVSAGDGVHNVDPDNEGVWVPQALEPLQGSGFTVTGESMMPYIQPGDICVFKPYVTPRNGFTYLVVRRDGEKSVKNIEWIDNRWMLTSYNPNFPPEPAEDFQIVGLLVGWYRAIGEMESLTSKPSGLNLKAYFSMTPY